MQKIKILVIVFSILALSAGVNFINQKLTTDNLKESLAATSTPPNFKVAFIGDSDGGNVSQIMNLIKAEGAQMVVDTGDYAWDGGGESTITGTLGSNFLYIGAKGNHDNWTAPSSFFQQRIAASGATLIDGLSGSDTNYAVKHNGLTVTAVGDGSSALFSTYASHINTQLSKSDSIWKICAFHKNGIPNHDTWIPNKAMMAVAIKSGNEMGVEVYEACRQQGAMIFTGHSHIYSRSKTITKYAEYEAGNSAFPGVSVDSSQPGDTLLLKPGSNFTISQGPAGSGPRSYNCDHHDPEENGTSNPWYKGDWWWDAVYANNMYMRGGKVIKKNCFRTGQNEYGYLYKNNVFPINGISRHTLSATFITFNVDGNPKKAVGYTKNFDGQVVDTFTIFADSSGTVNTPTPTPPVSTVKTPTPFASKTPTPNPSATKTPTPKPSVTPTTTPNIVNGDCNTDGTINILDFQLFSNSFGKSSGQPGYNSNCDFNADNTINILDFQILSNNFGSSGITPTPTGTAEILVNETFTLSAGNFTFGGGIWAVFGGRYEITSESTSTTTHLNNRSVHNTVINGDFVLTADAKAVSKDGWDDFAVIFGYQDSANYYFVSFNEQNDNSTSGIFKVVNGTITQIADITAPISAGTDYQVKVEKSGAAISVFLDGSPAASASDSTFTVGKVGFGTKNNKASYDNLVVGSR